MTSSGIRIDCEHTAHPATARGHRGVAGCAIVMGSGVDSPQRLGRDGPVKTVVRRPVTRYRNEAVYRSAQQLIAARRPAPKVVPRSLIFLGGIAVGLLLAYQIYSLTILRKEAGPLVSPTLTPELVARRAPAAADKTVAAESSPNVGAPSSAPIPAITSDPLPDPAGTEEPLGPALRAIPVPRSTVNANRVSTVPAFNRATTWATLLVSEFTLSGFLQSAQAQTLTVEFTLHFSDSRHVAVEGAIHFVFGKTRFASNRVVGEIVGRTLTLRETGQLWKRQSDYPLTNPAVFEVGRSFVLPLPEKSGSQLIIGTWSQGNLKGTLQLSATPPW